MGVRVRVEVGVAVPVAVGVGLSVGVDVDVTVSGSGVGVGVGAGGTQAATTNIETNVRTGNARTGPPFPPDVNLLGYKRPPAIR